ncbi:MAG: hypothetical protein AAGA46_06760 [Cyanobacteria bacterium P01_F01_bin.13]
MQHTLPIINTTVMDSQLTYPILAHAGELHGRPATPAPVDEKVDNSSTEPETPALSTGPETVEVTEVDAFTSEPPPIAGLPAGFGESLLTILVGFPWLLIVLRMQLHTQPRS